MGPEDHDHRARDREADGSPQRTGRMIHPTRWAGGFPPGHALRADDRVDTPMGSHGAVPAVRSPERLMLPWASAWAPTRAPAHLHGEGSTSFDVFSQVCGLASRRVRQTGDGVRGLLAGAASFDDVHAELPAR